MTTAPARPAVPLAPSTPARTRLAAVSQELPGRMLRTIDLWETFTVAAIEDRPDRSARDILAELVVTLGDAKQAAATMLALGDTIDGGRA